MATRQMTMNDAFLPCQSCEILARGFVALGLHPRDVTNMLLTKYRPLAELWRCISFILELDSIEEETRLLDLPKAGRSFQEILGKTSLHGQSPTELVPWIDQFIRFVELERKLLKEGYGSIENQSWYQMKCVDVQWCAYQTARLAGHSDAAAQHWVSQSFPRFFALEVFDDVTDQEHYHFWRGYCLDQPVRLGEAASHLACTICPTLHLVQFADAGQQVRI